MNPLSLLTGVKGYLISAAVAALLAGAGVGYVVHRMDASELAELKQSDADAQAAALVEVLHTQQAIDKQNAEAAVAAVQAQQKIVTNTITVTKEIPTYVHDQITCPGVTYGFVRLLYAAETGVDAATVNLPAGVVDDACAPYAPSALAADLAADFGDARGNSQQLTDLIASVRANNEILDKSANQ